MVFKQGANRCIGPSFNCSPTIFAIFSAIWYHYDWVHTYQINMSRKFKYLSKTAQRSIHFIISLDVLLGNNLQRYKAFACNRKRPATVSRRGQCRKPLQDSKFSCLFSCALKNKGSEVLIFLWET